MKSSPKADKYNIMFDISKPHGVKKDKLSIDNRKFINNIRFNRRSSILYNQPTSFSNARTLQSMRPNNFGLNMTAKNKVNSPSFNKSEAFKRHITFDSNYFMVYQQMMLK